jgi:predicted esterase
MRAAPANLMRRTRCVAARLAVLVAVAASVFGEEVPTGRVLERVQCAADATQSYALYVPTRFDRAHHWPVLFCFDPGARGAAAVEHFSAAAEKFGWIVAGSNNSRNGPWDANVVAINAMVRDVDRFFPVESRRVYVAGLSGGARVACQVAVSGIAHGVIACSAGFMNSETPPKVAFPFFGTAGVTDFNYLELRRVDRELEDRHAAHRVVIHPGGHEWPAADVAMQAVAWLELQAARTGIRERDPTWIQQEFAARQAAVPVQPADEHLRALQSLAADFNGLADVSEIDRQIATLASSREVRDARKAARAAEAHKDR